ncbi:MAG TPA: hypothetical protein VKU03_14570, partial [Roseiarcus sp.]|nr:hypothetical protein [Roseiarcus sp.]
HKNDAITALLSRKLPSVITRGLGGALPKNALALADPETPQTPERAALLAKAAALSAPSPLRPSPPALTPLERAARLYAPLPSLGPFKPALVAVKIGKSDFGVMIAPKTPSAALGGTPPAAPASPHADALAVAFMPTAQIPDASGGKPLAHLRADVFAEPASEAGMLRGTD